MLLNILNCVNNAKYNVDYVAFDLHVYRCVC